jgi:hypothetical protein
MRVVSLLPSATDTIVALQLSNLLVGRSHEVQGAHCNSCVCAYEQLLLQESSSALPFKQGLRTPSLILQPTDSVCSVTGPRSKGCPP